MQLALHIANVKKYLLQTQYRRTFYRIIILVALFSIYAAADWNWLNSFLREAVAWSMVLLGHKAAFMSASGNSFQSLLIDNVMPMSFVTGCTYLHLAFLLVPFCWRFNKPLVVNIGTSAILIAGILILNIARITLVMHFSGNSFTSWFYIHGGVDILAHGGALFLVISAAVKADSGPV